MTLEEAKQLGPGDVIQAGTSSNEPHRIIIGCEIHDSSLWWSEDVRYPTDYKHSWDIRKITLVKKVYNQEINNYEIY